MPDDLETLRAAAKVLEALRSDPAEAAPVAEAPAEAPQPTPQASSLRDVGVAGEDADLGPAPPAGRRPSALSMTSRGSPKGSSTSASPRSSTS
jgi:hypothetical protein